MRQLIGAIVAMLIVPAAYAVTADDVVCDKCISQADIGFGAVGTGRIKQKAITTSRLADKAVGAAAINPSQVQRRVTKDCPFSSIQTINQDGTVVCAPAVLWTKWVTTSGPSTGVAFATCPAGQIVVSASCDCNNVGGTRNFGVLFACTTAGDSAGVGCFSESSTFDPFKPPPEATVVAFCVDGLTLSAIQSTQATGTQELDPETLRTQLVNRELDYQAALASRRK